MVQGVNPPTLRVSATKKISFFGCLPLVTTLSISVLRYHVGFIKGPRYIYCMKLIPRQNISSQFFPVWPDGPFLENNNFKIKSMLSKCEFYCRTEEETLDFFLLFFFWYREIFKLNAIYLGKMPRLVQIETWFFEIIPCTLSLYFIVKINGFKGLGKTYWKN